MPKSLTFSRKYNDYFLYGKQLIEIFKRCHAVFTGVYETPKKRKTRFGVLPEGGNAHFRSGQKKKQGRRT